MRYLTEYPEISNHHSLGDLTGLASLYPGTIIPISARLLINHCDNPATKPQILVQLKAWWLLRIETSETWGQEIDSSNWGMWSNRKPPDLVVNIQMDARLLNLVLKFDSETGKIHPGESNIQGLDYLEAQIHRLLGSLVGGK